MSASAVAELITKAFVLCSTGRIVHLQEQKFLIFKKKILITHLEDEETMRNI